MCMLIKKVSLLLLILSLSAVGAQAQEIRPLEPGKAVEREIAGGESHTYQITLQPGQFVRVVLEQKAIDLALKLAVPDG